MLWTHCCGGGGHTRYHGGWPGRGVSMAGLLLKGVAPSAARGGFASSAAHCSCSFRTSSCFRASAARSSSYSRRSEVLVRDMQQTKLESDASIAVGAEDSRDRGGEEEVNRAGAPPLPVAGPSCHTVGVA